MALTTPGLWPGTDAPTLDVDRNDYDGRARIGDAGSEKWRYFIDSPQQFK